MSYQSFVDERNERIKRQGENKSLKVASQEWLNIANATQYSYNFEFMGRPIIQYPHDIVQIQELIFQVKPDLIIETGIAHGGSVVMSGSFMALLDIAEGKDPHESNRKVLAIDIDIRSHNHDALKQHPIFFKMQLIEGSSIDPDVIRQVRSISSNYKKIMVILDSNHTHDHVLHELNAYSSLVSVDSYCIVFDTVIENLPIGSFPDRPWDKGNNPMSAIDSWLPENANFQIDKMIDDKLQVSVGPRGYLKKIKP